MMVRSSIFLLMGVAAGCGDKADQGDTGQAAVTTTETTTITETTTTVTSSTETTTTTPTTDADGDGALAADDCDDSDPEIHPGAEELCDGVDNDCDGETDVGATDATIWYADTDGDGWGDANSTSSACEVPEGYGSDASDCDDSAAAVNPDAAETCDGVDNDCDGRVDGENAVDADTWYTDLDGDGFGGADSAVLSCSEPAGFISDGTDCDDEGVFGEWTWPGAAPEDSLIDCMKDLDGDGFGDAAPATAGVTAGTDCDDNASQINPGADEVCDEADNDCDGDIDDDAIDAALWYADADGDGWGSGDPTGTTPSCEMPTGYVGNDDDCDDDEATASPDGVEVCDGGIDNDCSGLADDDDPATDVGTMSSWTPDDDGDGWGTDSPAAPTTVSCAQPSGLAPSGDCDDADASINPGAVEIWYDGLDTDCDGASDYDADADDHDSEDHGGGDCDDADEAINPDADEDCDGVDNDCDGNIDDDDPDASCGYESLVGDWQITVRGSTLCDFSTTGTEATAASCPDCTYIFDSDHNDLGTGCLTAFDALLGYYEDYGGAGEYLSFQLYGTYELGPFPAALTASGSSATLTWGGYSYFGYYYGGSFDLY